MSADDKIDARDLLAQSAQAIEVLQRLVARLEVFTDQVEGELARRQPAGGDGGSRDG